MAGRIYREGWSLDDIDWAAFAPAKVDPDLLAAVKAAALVEFNAADYVDYLKRVFSDVPATFAAIEKWGVEETQHGVALGRWAQLADPSYDFEAAVARFRAGYRPAHFDEADGSVRGSRTGELIARCVVECGTSSFYSSMRDTAEEPVLKEVAGRIAADEFRHYKLFYDLMNKAGEAQPSFWHRLWIAMTRVSEAEDDELAYAYYCGNVAPEREAAVPYDRKLCARAYEMRAMRMYRRQHVEKAAQMIAKAIGAHPQGTIVRLAGRAMWNFVRLRISLSPRDLPHAA